MNPFLLGPRERLADWKTFRTSLPTFDEAEQIEMVAQYWAKAPLCRYAYDAEDASSWPTIWEMISENNWCGNSVAIGMEQTLRLSGWDPTRLKMILVKDHDISDLRFVVEIDAKYWLNYDYGIVTDIPTTERSIICAWQFDGKIYKAV